jgi:sec-independent protein translocase protein TatA
MEIVYAIPIPGPAEMVLIVLALLIVFGAGKLPEVGKALGKGIREFKSAREAPPDDETQKPSEEKGENA